jgi:hypothetical protein
MGRRLDALGAPMQWQKKSTPHGVLVPHFEA